MCLIAKEEGVGKTPPSAIVLAVPLYQTPDTLILVFPSPHPFFISVVHVRVHIFMSRVFTFLFIHYFFIVAS